MSSNSSRRRGPRATLFLFATVIAAAANSGFSDLHGGSQDPFQSAAKARVFLFVRTDCPITNRYAPELQRLAGEYKDRSVAFWLIYPDRSETIANVQQQVSSFGFPGTPLLDPQHKLVARAHALVAPEAAVFDIRGQLIYHGRIDNRWVAAGRSRPAATVHDLEDAIAAALQGWPVKESVTRAVGCSLADVE